MKQYPPKTGKSFQQIPGPKGKWLTGDISQIDFCAFHHYLKEQVAEHGPIFRLSFAKKTALVLSHPGTVQSILKARPHHYRRVSTMETVFAEMGINGVFSSEGDRWKLQRQLMNPAFKSSQLKHYFPIVQQSCERLNCRLQHLVDDDSVVDLQVLLQNFTVDITTHLAFGVDINSLDNSNTELQQMLSRVFPMISQRLKAPFPYWRYVKFTKDKRLDTALIYLRNLAEQFIETAEQQLINVNQPENILQAMIQARNEEGRGFNQDQLFGNVITLLLAGEDTTANTLAWTLHYLAQHPELFDEIRYEIASQRDVNAPVSYQELDHYPLTFAAIQEAMRIMPVVPVLYLENIAQQFIEGYEIPAGTMLIIMLSQAGFNPELFPNPESYQPQRWLNISPETQKNYAKELMPFGGGPRLCPGMQLAFVEMKAALISMLGKYQFTHAQSPSDVKSKFAFTVMPKQLTMHIRCK